jgi:hypothetical protein
MFGWEDKGGLVPVFFRGQMSSDFLQNLVCICKQFVPVAVFALNRIYRAQQHRYLSYTMTIVDLSRHYMADNNKAL